MQHILSIVAQWFKKLPKRSYKLQYFKQSLEKYLKSFFKMGRKFKGDIFRDFQPLWHCSIAKEKRNPPKLEETQKGEIAI